MRSILHIALKDLRLLSRDWWGLFWIVPIPLLYALFFGTVMGGSGVRDAKLNVAIVDQDDTTGSRALRDRLAESPNVILQSLDQAEAEEAVRSGGLLAFVVVPKGYGSANRFFGAGSTLVVHLDPARAIEGEMFRGVLLEKSYAGVQEQFRDPEKINAMIQASIDAIDADPTSATQNRATRIFLVLAKGIVGYMPRSDAAGQPVFEPVHVDIKPMTDVRISPRSAYEVAFPSSALWSLMGCASAFSISLVQERVHGTLTRLRLAPVSRAQILAGKGLACFITSLAVAALLFLLAGVVLHVRIPDPLLLTLAVACTAFCFTGLMLLMSTIGDSEQAVTGAGWGIMLIMAMLGGAMVPLFMFPPVLQTLSHISPVKWGVLALEGAIWRGFTLAQLAPPCIILIGIGLGGFTLGVWNFRRKQRS